MNIETILILAVCGALALALTLILFACLWAAAHAPVNRRKTRLPLGQLLKCSHPEWN